eukprot:CAMPEP_0177660352 /NCGR_PEP_ID=MMETSP0447-20121125/17989_1 /TAXON_ID=0 /ORGANISM="Stygamoeba regulata, Strain BSH-02190019" /LENGTH=127 /DNA_ID=CAMNT_0019165401 /DNA_START=82 /DNA_END=465 /DNA_ORIENTATION=-
MFVSVLRQGARRTLSRSSAFAPVSPLAHQLRCMTAMSAPAPAPAPAPGSASSHLSFVSTAQPNSYTTIGSMSFKVQQTVPSSTMSTVAAPASFLLNGEFKDVAQMLRAGTYFDLLSCAEEDELIDDV